MGQKIKIIKGWRKKSGTRGIPSSQIGIVVDSKWRDIAIRAAKTFAQAFLASLVVDISRIGGGWNVIRTALISAAAAGISAVMNLAIAALRKGDDFEYQYIQTASDETGEGE